MLALDWSDREALLLSICLVLEGVVALCARTRGEPSSARCEQRLSERLTPCPCEPVCACIGMRGHAGNGTSGPTMQRGTKEHLHFSSAHPHAAQRAVPGWRGGLGRVGADLASAGSMRPPPSPARHVSTARLATTKVSPTKAAQHESPPQKSGQRIQIQRGEPTHIMCGWNHAHRAATRLPPGRRAGPAPT